MLAKSAERIGRILGMINYCVDNNSNCSIGRFLVYDTSSDRLLGHYPTVQFPPPGGICSSVSVVDADYPAETHLLAVRVRMSVCARVVEWHRRHYGDQFSNTDLRQHSCLFILMQRSHIPVWTESLDASAPERLTFTTVVCVA